MKKDVPYFFAEWELGGVYHVYNRAVSLNRLFVDRNDRFKFIEYIRNRVSTFAEVFAFALVGNHFHMMIRLEDLQTARARLYPKPFPTKREAELLRGDASYNQVVGDYFASIFRGYALYFNNRHKRSGTLFDQTVRRIRVRDDLISRRLICYIHCNEMKHGLHAGYRGLHERTSFYHYDEAIGRSTYLARQAVLARFGGSQEFLEEHERYASRFSSSLVAFDEQAYFGYGMPHVDVAPRYAWLDGEG